MKRILLALTFIAACAAQAADTKIIFIAGRPSHPPGMHEFRAGCLLLQQCLAPVKGVNVTVYSNGWPHVEGALDKADAVVIYADGGGGHPALQADRLKFMDKLETVVFSSDAALNNEIRRNIMASMAGMDVKIGQLLETSLSQSVHADALATLHMMEGKITYDNTLHKWVSEKTDANLVNLAKQVDKIAEKYGLTAPHIMRAVKRVLQRKR